MARQPKQIQEEAVEITHGSGNVFRDLGFKNADELLRKSRLVHEITKVMGERKLTQEQLAKEIGIDQPAVSKLLRGNTTGYSTDRLITILNRLGHDVEIMVRPRPVNAPRPGLLFVSEKRATYAKAAAKKATPKKK